MDMSETINELAAALAKAQAQMEGAARDGLNPHFRSKYATLSSVWDAARGPLASNGLAVVQSAGADADTIERVTITTILLHSSGQWIRESMTMSTGDGRPQSVGSAISYGRRYQLAAMTGVAPEDDDAEAAEARPAQRPSAAPAKVAPARADGAVTVVRVEAKPTKNPNVKKYLVVLSDGREVSTVKAALALLAEQCAAEQAAVVVTTTTTQWGENLLALERADIQIDHGLPVDASEIPF